MSDQLAISVREAAHRLGISKSLLYLEIEKGKINSVKLGKRRLIRVVDAEAYLTANLQQNAA